MGKQGAGMGVGGRRRGGEEVGGAEHPRVEGSEAARVEQGVERGGPVGAGVRVEGVEGHRAVREHEGGGGS